MSYLALGDVPTVDVNTSFLTPPPATAVSDLSYTTPGTFTVRLPSTSKATFSPAQLGLIGGAAVLALLVSRKRR